jgi:hypothetical protein
MKKNCLSFFELKAIAKLVCVFSSMRCTDEMVKALNLVPTEQNDVFLKLLKAEVN